MSDADYLLALKLQTEFNQELEAFEEESKVKDERKEKWKHRLADNDQLNSTQNLVHPEWESLDPTPDVHALFNAFDGKFFQGRLKCVTLEWSKRMYSCAGICYSHRNKFGMAITIRLSEPLLKLRSRKDLVETLLHEMIHAYCSVLGIREGNGGHGPNFKKIMHGINKVAGTNITVYHTFHDEVDVYKTHWWRCNGICQNRKPFFGYVKRTCNRAPGPNDIWWTRHLESCGGTFLKIKGPEKKNPKSEKENIPKSRLPTKDIRSFFGNESNKPSNPKGFVKSNGGGTIVINDDNVNPSSKPCTSTPSKVYQGGTVNKVIGFKDLTESPNRSNTLQKTIGISGTGYSLTGTASTAAPSNPTSASNSNSRDHVRNIWANRFTTTAPKRPVEENDSDKTNKDDIGIDEKRRKLDSDTASDKDSMPNVVELDETWTEIDEEIMFKKDKQVVIDISSSDEEDNTESPVIPTVQRNGNSVKQTTEERQRQIKQEILESSDCLFSEDDIVLIDDDFNDELLNANVELADTSLIDDLFGEDTLLRDFKKQNSVVASNSRYHSDPKNDIVSCPVCQDSVTREFFPEHLDGCVGISIKVVAPTSKAKVVPFYKKKSKNLKQKRSPESVRRALQNAGYDENDIEEVVGVSVRDSSSEETQDRRRGLDTSTHSCPVCGREVDVNRINEHLDICLPED